jgi:hypothetical protein
MNAETQRHKEKTLRICVCAFISFCKVLAIWRLGGSNSRVPRIIEYSIVLEKLREQKLRCVYYNSGAFAFEDGVATQSLGWIGPEDDSIKPKMRHLVRQVSSPYEQNLAAALRRAWQEIVPGKIWVMPSSHWAFELDFGSREWMSALLESVQIDAKLLQPRTNAAAIEFDVNEADLLEKFVLRLLQMLRASDFSIAFPGRAVICSVHHHKQLWWTSAEIKSIEMLSPLPLGEG